MDEMCIRDRSYDWTAMRTAGWVCTTLVFVWPLAAALTAVQPLVTARRGGRVPRWAYAPCALLALYAANMEQLMVGLLLCLLALRGYDLFTKRRPAGFLWVLPVSYTHLLWNPVRGPRNV